MAETLSTISSVSLVLSILCFVLAVFLFFKFKIVSVINELSGRTAKKSIAKMRAENEKNGSKGYRASPVNVQRGQITQTEQGLKTTANATAPIVDNSRPETGLLNESRAPMARQEETAVLEKETGLLEDDETQLLDSTKATGKAKPPLKKLDMLDSILLIHTDEVIQ